MRNFSKILSIWLPAIVWMAVIFYFSSRHRVQVSTIDSLNFLFFKSLHVIEYSILYLLLFRAIYLSQGKKISTKTYIIAAIITIVYASSDEFHQTFIATRTGRVRDIFIDGIGVTAMYLYLKTHLFIVKKYFK